MIYLQEGNFPLNEAFSSEIVQEANSTYQLTFKFPTSDPKWVSLTPETELVADDLHGEQYFTIFEVEKQHGYVTVYANQVATLLNGYSINKINVDRVNGATVMNALVAGFKRETPFTFFSDVMSKHTLNLKDISAMEALAKDKHSIVGQWGGDLVRDKYSVRLLEHGGIENESLFAYKKNMKSFQETKSTKELRTRIHFKKVIEAHEEGKKDQILTVTIDSPLITKYKHIYEADMEVQDQDVVDQKTLEEYGKRYFRETLCDMIEESLEIDVVGQADQPVHMFDIVSLFHEGYDVDLRKKITKYKFNPMSIKLVSIGFGEVTRTLADSISGMVNDSVDKKMKSYDAEYEAKVQKLVDNANAEYDKQAKELEHKITDGIEQAKAQAEVVKQEINGIVAQKFLESKKLTDSEIAKANAKAEEALSKAGTIPDVGKLSDQIKTLILNSPDLSRKVTETFNQTDSGAIYNKIYQNIKHDFAVTDEIGPVLAGINQKIQSQTVEFNKLTESNKLYERIIGKSETDAPDKLSRLVMSSEIFQTEVGKYVTSDNNLIVNSETMDQHVLVNENRPGVNVSVSDGIFTIKAQGATSYNWSGFTLPIYIRKIYRGETYSLGFKYRIRGALDSDFNVIIKNHILNRAAFTATAGRSNSPVSDEWKEFQGTFYMSSDFEFGNHKNLPFYAYITKNGWIEIKEVMLVRGSSTGPYKPSQFDDAFAETKALDAKIGQASNKALEAKQTAEGAQEKANGAKAIADQATGDAQEARQLAIGAQARADRATEISQIAQEKADDAQTKAIQVAEQARHAQQSAEATRTQVTQLAGSYSIKNINSAGDIISGVNLGADGTNRFVGKLTHITGETQIDNAVIKSAMVDKLKTGNFESESVTTQILASNAVTADKLLVDSAMISKLVSNQAFIRELMAQRAFITQLSSIDFSAERIKSGRLQSNKGDTIFDLDSGILSFLSNNTGIFRHEARASSQGMMFLNNPVNVAGNSKVNSKVIIGADRRDNNVKNNWSSGGFNGIIVDTIKDIASTDHDNADKVSIVGDRIKLIHTYGYDAATKSDPTGWVFENFPNVILRPINANRNSQIHAGDIRFLEENKSFSFRSFLSFFNTTMKHLGNYTNRRDVFKPFEY